MTGTVILLVAPNQPGPARRVPIEPAGAEARRPARN